MLIHPSDICPPFPTYTEAQMQTNTTQKQTLHRQTGTVKSRASKQTPALFYSTLLAIQDPLAHYGNLGIKHWWPPGTMPMM